jgi:putative redox protein
MPTIKTVTVNAQNLEGWQIEAKAHDHVMRIDQPVALRGTDTGPTPLEYLFAALAGCIITTGKIVAFQQKLPYRGMEVEVSGELDTDFLMGRPGVERAGFTEIRVTATIDGDMTPEEKQRFLQDIDRRCPVSDNLINTSHVVFKAR